MSEDTCQIFSRCSLGKKRWFWVLYASFESMCNGDEPINTGYAASSGEAEKASPPGAKTYGNATAAHYHRRQCAKRRADKPPSKVTEATPKEYLYTDWLSDWDNETRSSPHLIVKKTKKLVFVEANQYHSNPWERVTYALNRAEIDEKGSVYSHPARQIFFTTPYEQRHHSWVPPELAVLGLQRGATQVEIKAAYRKLARQHHPDRGGDPEKFKEIHAAYEQALAS